MERTTILTKSTVLDFLALCNSEQLCIDYASLIQDLDLGDGFRGHYFQVPHLLLKYAPETLTSTKNVFIGDTGAY